MTDAIVPLTRRPAWGALEARYHKLRDMHPRTLFAEDPGRGEADFADKLLSAMRFQFGGHHEKAARK